MNKISIITLLLIAFTYALPTNFTWGIGATRNLLTPSANQNNPNRCESGWAFATINSLNTRINIQMYKTSFKYPAVSLSPQVLLECNQNNFGCLGGEPFGAFKWIKQNSITDSSCKNYKAKGYTNGVDCLSRSKCEFCESKYNCSYQVNSKIYSLQSVGSVSGQTAMMNQIYNNGPIACGIAATKEFKTYKTGIFNDTSKAYYFNHYVSVYGWGFTSKNESYWLVQNSYGPNWGQEGNIKIAKGINNIGIQSACYFGVPLDTWTNDLRNHTISSSNEVTISQSLTQSLPLTTYLTSTMSSYSPNFCQASWAFSVVQAIADSQLVKTNYQNVKKFSIQALLNCGVGTCQKGNPFDALVFVHKYGIPQEGCQQYQAQNPVSGSSCTPANNCASCGGNSIFKGNCSQVKGYKRWYIQNYGVVSGETQMKMELTNHQALICGIELSHAFRQYKGGIFSQTTVAPKVNYYVQVVAHGTENGQNYWLGRAFFGTSWGISGFFKIKVGSSNLGIESKCYWAGPLI